MSETNYISVGSTDEAIETLQDADDTVKIDWDFDEIDFDNRPVWSDIKKRSIMRDVTAWTYHSSVGLSFDSIRDFEEHIGEYEEIDEIASKIDEVDEVNGWEAVESENGTAYKFEKFGNSVALTLNSHGLAFEFDGVDIRDPSINSQNRLNSSSTDYSVKEYTFLLAKVLIENDPVEIQIEKTAKEAMKESVQEANGVGQEIAERVIRNIDFSGVENIEDAYDDLSTYDIDGIGPSKMVSIRDLFFEDIEPYSVVTEENVAYDPIAEAVESEKKRLVTEEGETQIVAEAF